MTMSEKIQNEGRLDYTLEKNGTKRHWLNRSRKINYHSPHFRPFRHCLDILSTNINNNPGRLCLHNIMTQIFQPDYFFLFLREYKS